MSEIGAIINVGTKIAEYFGFIEGIDTKVTKLLHQAFLSAKTNLECALDSSGQNQIEYIKQAKAEFIRAVAVEENENKIISLLGLSMCQSLLGDNANAQVTFNKINDVELTRAEKTKATAIDAVENVTFIGCIKNILRLGIFMPTVPVNLPTNYEIRIQNFAEVKESALSIRNKLLK